MCLKYVLSTINFDVLHIIFQECCVKGMFYTRSDNLLMKQSVKNTLQLCTTVGEAIGGL